MIPLSWFKCLFSWLWLYLNSNISPIMYSSKFKGLPKYLLLSLIFIVLTVKTKVLVLKVFVFLQHYIWSYLSSLSSNRYISSLPFPSLSLALSFCLDLFIIDNDGSQYLLTFCSFPVIFRTFHLTLPGLLNDLKRTSFLILLTLFSM